MPWPQKYNDDMPLRVEQYLDVQDESNKFSWLARGRQIPSISDLALALGLKTRQTVYDWEEQYEEFGYQIKRLRMTQEVLALDGGLANNMNAQIVKMVLAKHGYSDAAKVDHTSSDGSMTPKGKTLDDFYQDIPEESDEEG